MSIQIDLENIDSSAIIISTADPNIQKQTSMEIATTMLEEDQIHDHPDFIVLKTEENSIGIDEIKGLILKIQYKPYRAKRKIALVEQAEKLTTEAQNAFLKTLEDIPPNTVIILTTSNHTYLLPTILSRCKIYEISSREEIGNDFNSEEITEGDLMQRFKIVESIVNTKLPAEKRKLSARLIKSLTDFYSGKDKKKSRKRI